MNKNVFYLYLYMGFKFNPCKSIWHYHLSTYYHLIKNYYNFVTVNKNSKLWNSLKNYKYKKSIIWNSLKNYKYKNMQHSLCLMRCKNFYFFISTTTNRYSSVFDLQLINPGIFYSYFLKVSKQNTRPLAFTSNIIDLI